MSAYEFDIAMSAMAKELAEARRAEKVIRKKWMKAQERLNRVKKLTPGQARVWKLDGIAQELQYTLDTEDDMPPESVWRLEALILVCKRLEYDLIVLNEVVHDKVPRGKLHRSDPRHWRGPRP